MTSSQSVTGLRLKVWHGLALLCVDFECCRTNLQTPKTIPSYFGLPLLLLIKWSTHGASPRKMHEGCDGLAAKLHPLECFVSAPPGYQFRTSPSSKTASTLSPSTTSTAPSRGVAKLVLLKMMARQQLIEPIIARMRDLDIAKNPCNEGCQSQIGLPGVCVQMADWRQLLRERNTNAKNKKIRRFEERSNSPYSTIIVLHARHSHAFTCAWPWC